MALLEIRNLSLSFGGLKALSNFNFSLDLGQLLGLIGPNGAGKTTAFNVATGVYRPNNGEIQLAGQSIVGMQPHQINQLGVARTFQNVRLFGGLSVLENVLIGFTQSLTHGFAGTVLRTPRHQREDIAHEGEAMSLLATFHLDRRAHELAGSLPYGDQRRLEIARALATDPKVLLLDEPLGAIDLKLRKEMQLELKALNKELGTTFVYVTHDQEEALTMSDRIAVMDNARVAQLGVPAEIYENPRTAFVAKFIGESNFFEGRAGRQGAHWVLEWAYGGAARLPSHPALHEGRQTRIAVRPEWMDVWRPGEVPEGENALGGKIEDVIYLGEIMHVLVRVQHVGTVTVAVRNERQLIKPLPWKRGEEAAVAWLPEDCQILEET
jgi:branched-chain amino acid transport system ATP-binding protein